MSGQVETQGRAEPVEYADAAERRLRRIERHISLWRMLAVVMALLALALSCIVAYLITPRWFLQPWFW